VQQNLCARGLDGKEIIMNLYDIIIIVEYYRGHETPILLYIYIIFVSGIPIKLLKLSIAYQDIIIFYILIKTFLVSPKLSFKFANRVISKPSGETS
jgi:hypothetical protein